MENYEVLRALTLSEIQTVIADCRQATEYAKRAWFDCVELHAALGYLPNQFLVASASLCTDAYSLSIDVRSLCKTKL
ncbi:hypothetical protein [Pseudomonas fluorescens]|jgi:N-ethylmaleimide reductase|nr:hypothetical protein [Pseudomonas fluorescens]